MAIHPITSLRAVIAALLAASSVYVRQSYASPWSR